MDKFGHMDDLQKFVAAKVKNKFKDIFDPEIPVNIVDLGLIYHVEINKEMDCQVLMTLTAPAMYTVEPETKIDEALLLLT